MLEVLANTLTLGMHTRKGSPSSSIILVYEQWVGVTRNKKTPQRRASKAKRNFLYLGTERYILFMNTADAYANKKSNYKTGRKNKKTSD